jgi:hypothetical protein
MTEDAADNCTFWYTNEYSQTMACGKPLIKAQDGKLLA